MWSEPALVGIDATHLRCGGGVVVVVVASARDVSSRDACRCVDPSLEHVIDIRAVLVTLPIRII